MENINQLFLTSRDLHAEQSHIHTDKWSNKWFGIKITFVVHSAFHNCHLFLFMVAESNCIFQLF